MPQQVLHQFVDTFVICTDPIFLDGIPMELIPALEAIYKDDHPFLVIQKSAQVFACEFLVNTALWAADTKQGGRGNALYVVTRRVAWLDWTPNV